MNYMLEIKLFYDWLETHELSSMGITLWHALMQVASRSGWREELQISLSTLIGRTSLSRTSIYKEREILKKYGLVDYRSLGGRHAGIYAMKSFEFRVASAARTQTRTQTYEHGEFASSIASAMRTQAGTQRGNIYRLNYTNDEKERKNVAGSPAPVSTDTPSAKRKKVARKKEKCVSPFFDADTWLEGLDEPWCSAMRAWSNYKRSRRECYKSELSARRCLARLKHLAPIIRIQPIRSSIKVLRIIGPGCSRCGEELFCIESCPLRKDNISVTSFILRPTNAPDDCWKNSTANEKWDKDLFPRIASALFSHDKNNIPHEPDRIAHRPHGRG